MAIRKMLLVFLAIIMVLALVLTAVGCGDDENGAADRPEKKLATEPSEYDPGPSTRNYTIGVDMLSLAHPLGQAFKNNLEEEAVIQCRTKHNELPNKRFFLNFNVMEEILESGSGILENPGAPDTRITGLELGENIFSWNVSNDTCPPSKDLVKIEVEDFLFPTVITPNGDGKNDSYYIQGIEQFRDSELVILNRWGEEVFSSGGPYLNNWFGTDKNGNELPEDTYYVVLKISAERSWKGYLVIIR